MEQKLYILEIISASNIFEGEYRWNGNSVCVLQSCYQPSFIAELTGKLTNNSNGHWKCQPWPLPLSPSIACGHFPFKHLAVGWLLILFCQSRAGIGKGRKEWVGAKQTGLYPFLSDGLLIEFSISSCCTMNPLFVLILPSPWEPIQMLLMSHLDYKRRRLYGSSPPEITVLYCFNLGLPSSRWGLGISWDYTWSPAKRDQFIWSKCLLWVASSMALYPT